MKLECPPFLALNTRAQTLELFYDVLLKNHYDFLECSNGDRLGRFLSERHGDLRTQGQLSNVACAISRDLFNRYRFQGEYAEDLTLGLMLIRDGHQIGMLSSIRVVHSHRRPVNYYLRRSFVDVSFLFGLFKDMIAPPVDCIIGSMQCATFIWGRLSALQLSNNNKHMSPVQLLRNIVVGITAADLSSCASTINATKGFDYPAFSIWLEELNKFIVIGRLTSSEGQRTASMIHTRQMFVDRLTNLASFVEDTYQILDEFVEQEIWEAVRKSLAMVIGSQLAFYSIDVGKTSKGIAVAELVRDLKRIMSADI